MSTKFKAAFEKLPFEKKEAIFNILAAKIEKATDDNDGAKINRIEKSMVRAMVKNWHSTSTKAINKALKTFPADETKRFSQKDANKLLSSLEKSYSGVEDKTASRVLKDLEEIYRVSKEQFNRRFKLDRAMKLVIFKGVHFDPLAKIVVPHNTIAKSAVWDISEQMVEKAVKFGVNDSAAWENLGRLQNVAIGDHFPKTLKPVVAKKIQEAVIEKGMNRADAGIFLKQELTKTLGGNISGALPASISTGQAATSAYFEGLAATNVTYARNFAQIQLMDEVGVLQVIFQAIIDNLTSEVCLQMDGRVFTVEQAKEHRQKVLEADDVESLKQVAPFTRSLEAFGTGAGRDLNSPDMQDALARAGVIVPPLHFRCRSELHPA